MDGTESSASRGARRLRRDAEANRQRTLQAAREVFAERGLAVNLDDIARHAGVGVATSYRLFGNKQALINELFEERVEALAVAAEQALAHDDPWEGFVGLLTMILELMAADRGLREVVFSEVGGRPLVAQARRRFMPAADAVMRRAQDAGRLRPDLAMTDLPLVFYMVGCVIQHTQPVSSAVWRRCLTIVLDGMSVRPGLTDMPVVALTTAEEERVAGFGPASS
ncbi:TetR/AcrR family transcriptional regulator [Streptomyces sp. CB02959]|uniref:TetR/AcrR family transcriptional regulator n=1 Tax=Streptomyces sp. CB02959 TaxID=2020330 RepID=UPI000C280395|nr:TetR/AcrR family transcriptional regulator [Streptomyces sp. CB02959]PJN41724.1 TetR family transcriptional regulator [Streptomyces sp. CB02959]